jgi:hypothetical protein
MSKRKELMAVLDAALRQLNEYDEMEAKDNAVKSVLEARQAELGDTEARLARAQDEFAKADAEHNDWRQKAAKEKAKGNEEIDRLQERLRTLEGQTTEAQAKFDNIIAGIAALSQRLKV